MMPPYGKTHGLSNFSAPEDDMDEKTALCTHCHRQQRVYKQRKYNEDPGQWVFKNHDKYTYGANRECPGSGTLAILEGPGTEGGA